MNASKIRLLFSVIILSSASCATATNSDLPIAQNEAACAVIDTARIRNDIYHLAGTIGPRATNHPGFDEAGRFLAGELRKAGTEPLPGTGDGYFQNFVFNGDMTSRNVLGYIPGVVPNRYIILGAHYDTVSGSPGADDNASGTAAVLEIARALGKRAAAGWKPHWTIIVALWGAEEDQPLALGSRHFVRSKIVKKRYVIAVINLDMVGRNRSNHIYVIGAKFLSYQRTLSFESPLLLEILKEANRKFQVPMELTVAEPDIERLFGHADTRHFKTEKPGFKQRFPIPHLFFFSGLHPEYHWEDDTPDKVDFYKVSKISCLTYHVLDILSDGARPVYTQPVS